MWVLCDEVHEKHHKDAHTLNHREGDKLWLLCFLICTDVACLLDVFCNVVLLCCLQAFEKKTYASEEIDSMRNEWASYVRSLLKI